MKKQELIKIIKEEIENVLLEESTPKVTPERALEILVKAIGPLKDSYNQPLNVGQLLTMDGLHKAVSKASAYYSVEKIIGIAVKQMKDAEKNGITGKVASDLAKELFDRARNQEAKAKEEKLQQGASPSPGKIEDGAYKTSVNYDDLHAGLGSLRKKTQVQKQFAAMKQAATEALGKPVKHIRAKDGKLAFIPIK